MPLNADDETPKLGEQYDVIVAGSGATGMVAAIRAHDLGLSVAVMEKGRYYGGTSALSGGGIWIAAHDGIANQDTPEAALDYLRAAAAGQGRDGLRRSFADHGRHLVRYLNSIGVHYQTFPSYPDYLQELPGVGRGRSMLPQDMDGAELKEDFFRLRPAHPVWIASGRYALNFAQARAFNKRSPGWRGAALKMVWKYWADVRWRCRTRIDRRLTWGRALVGALRRAMLARSIPLFLNCELTNIEREEGRMHAATFNHAGHAVSVRVRAGVILATGGFEQNQQLCDQWLPTHAPVSVAPTPADGNVGDALRIGAALGAVADNLSEAWWTPVIRLGSAATGSGVIAYPLGNHRGRPGSLMVNRNAARFANESASYDRLAGEMIQDQQRHGGTDHWLIFDARFRRTTPVGGLMPAWIMPDRRVPGGWWNSTLFRADSIDTLARRVDLDAGALVDTVERFNRSAILGRDELFQRGSSPFDRYNGDASHRPNPCLAPLVEAPFYAARVEIGNLGTKGGLRVNDEAAVLDPGDVPVAGLYAVGNAAASALVGDYPGGGATLGPGMTFAYRAAEAIARERTAALRVSPRSCDLNRGD